MNRLVQMNSGTEKCWGEGDVVLFSGVFLGGEVGEERGATGKGSIVGRICDC